MSAPQVMGDQEAPFRWCLTCEEPVTPTGYRAAVHSGTGLAEGPDGHLVRVTDEDPELRREADAIEADYRVSVSARFGFLRADRTDRPDPVHWEAGNGDEMRRRLPARLRRAAPSGQGARQ